MLQPIQKQAEPQRQWTELPFEEQLYGWMEALFFAADHPLSVDEIVEILATTHDDRLPEKIDAVIQELISQYNHPHRGMHLVEVAGGWQFRTNPNHSNLLRKLFAQRPPRLSQAAIECVAIVAYRQPVTRAEVSAIRGVDCGSMMRSLNERRLIQVVGRHDSPGRPYLYGTSPEFLEYFGLSNIKELPKLTQLTQPPTPKS